MTCRQLDLTEDSMTADPKTSRFVLLYHIRRALSLLHDSRLYEAGITLQAAIAIADEEDRATNEKPERIAK